MNFKMRDGEPLDSKSKYGIRIFVTGSKITPVNNKEQDSIYFYGSEYHYAVVWEHFEAPKLLKTDPFRTATDDEQISLKKACDFINLQRNRRKVIISDNLYLFRDSRVRKT